MGKGQRSTPLGPRRRGGGGDGEGGGGAYYYLECRKDAQCKCSMCEASIHATLDLRPSNHPFTPTNNADPSPPKSMDGKENRWPFFTHSSHTTPLHKSPSKRFARSSNRPSSAAVLESRKRSTRSWKRVALQLSLLALLLQFVVQWCMLSLHKPALCLGHARKIGEDSMAARISLADRLDYVRSKVSALVPNMPVFNCTGPNSQWRLIEYGLLVHSSCNVFTSMVESVSVWGYPAKTSGILGRSCVSRSFTVLSGRVLECKEGQIGCVDHPAGSSWVLTEWSASVVFLDGNTWILQYKRSAILEGIMGSLSGALHMAKCWLRLVFLRLKVNLDTLLPKENTIPSASMNEGFVPPT